MKALTSKLARYSSLFYKHESEKVLLNVYKAESTKLVCLMLSLLSDPRVLDPLPENRHYWWLKQKKMRGILLWRNISSLFTTRIPCWRWPMYVLFNILDMAEINSWILYEEITNKKAVTKSFPYKESLVAELLEKIDTKNSQGILEATQRKSSRRHCSKSNCQNKLSNVCKKCAKPSCGNHTN